MEGLDQVLGGSSSGISHLQIHTAKDGGNSGVSSRESTPPATVRYNQDGNTISTKNNNALLRNAVFGLQGSKAGPSNLRKQSSLSEQASGSLPNTPRLETADDQEQAQPATAVKVQDDTMSDDGERTEDADDLQQLQDRQNMHDVDMQEMMNQDMASEQGDEGQRDGSEPAFPHRVFHRYNPNGNSGVRNGIGMIQDTRNMAAQMAAIMTVPTSSNLSDGNPNSVVQSKGRPGLKTMRAQRFTGVYRQAGRWRAQFSHGGLVHQLGMYDTEEAAAQAWDRVAWVYRGRQADLNFPELVQEYDSEASKTRVHELMDERMAMKKPRGKAAQAAAAAAALQNLNTGDTPKPNGRSRKIPNTQIPPVTDSAGFQGLGSSNNLNLMSAADSPETPALPLSGQQQPQLDLNGLANLPLSLPQLPLNLNLDATPGNHANTNMTLSGLNLGNGMAMPSHGSLPSSMALPHSASDPGIAALQAGLQGLMPSSASLPAMPTHVPSPSPPMANMMPPMANMPNMQALPGMQNQTPMMQHSMMQQVPGGPLPGASMPHPMYGMPPSMHGYPMTYPMPGHMGHHPMGMMPYPHPGMAATNASPMKKSKLGQKVSKPDGQGVEKDSDADHSGEEEDQSEEQDEAAAPAPVVRKRTATSSKVKDMKETEPNHERQQSLELSRPPQRSRRSTRDQDKEEDYKPVTLSTRSRRNRRTPAGEDALQVVVPGDDDQKMDDAAADAHMGSGVDQLLQASLALETPKPDMDGRDAPAMGALGLAGDDQVGSDGDADEDDEQQEPANNGRRSSRRISARRAGRAATADPAEEDDFPSKPALSGRRTSRAKKCGEQRLNDLQNMVTSVLHGNDDGSLRDGEGRADNAHEVMCNTSAAPASQPIRVRPVGNGSAGGMTTANNTNGASSSVATGENLLRGSPANGAHHASQHNMQAGAFGPGGGMMPGGYPAGWPQANSATPGMMMMPGAPGMYPPPGGPMMMYPPGYMPHMMMHPGSGPMMTPVPGAGTASPNGKKKNKKRNKPMMMMVMAPGPYMMAPQTAPSPTAFPTPGATTHPFSYPSHPHGTYGYPPMPMAHMYPHGFYPPGSAMPYPADGSTDESDDNDNDNNDSSPVKGGREAQRPLASREAGGKSGARMDPHMMGYMMPWGMPPGMMMAPVQATAQKKRRRAGDSKRREAASDDYDMDEEVAGTM